MIKATALRPCWKTIQTPEERVVEPRTCLDSLRRDSLGSTTKPLKLPASRLSHRNLRISCFCRQRD